MNDFKSYKYISLNRENNAAVHGHPRVSVNPYFFAGETAYYSICIPPHSMTHLNLPKSIGLNQFGEI